MILIKTHKPFTRLLLNFTLFTKNTAILFLVFFLCSCSSLVTLKSESTTEKQTIKRSTQLGTTSDKNLDDAESASKDVNKSEDKAKTSFDLSQVKEQIFINAADSDLWEILPHLYQFSDIQHPYIENHKKYYLKNPDYLQRVSERAKPFLYFITEEVRKRNLPTELVLLPVIESAYQTYAYSHGRAAGIWQFIPSTGKYFGLKQNWWYDGRRDIYAATMAALDYLQQLNKRFKQDWLLTLAAYNAGGGTVSKAIRKNQQAGKGVEFWDLDLPAETKSYVPKLLAVAQLVKEKQQYQLNFVNTPNQAVIRYIDCKSQIDLSVVADLAGISMDEVFQYNPAFNQWSTNPQGPHGVLLPIDAGEGFEQKLSQLSADQRLQWLQYKIKAGDNLYSLARKHNISIKSIRKINQLKNNNLRVGKFLRFPSSKRNLEKYQRHLANSQSGKNLHPQRAKVEKKIHYRVRRGDSLYLIAQKFKVSVKKVVIWNNLSKHNYLQPGQKLTLYVNVLKSNA